MIEAFEFSATNQSGQPATLVAFVQFDADTTTPPGEADYLLGPIELFTTDGRTVNYVSGQLVSLEDSDAFTPSDESILDLLAIMQ
ncbi:MAG: hypothetical protein UMU75_10100 [Halomonas sp.]|nr:hypothetical protein [Halomonas sp.]